MEVLIRDHPFDDGNKRTAFTAGATLVELLTGGRVQVPTAEVVRVSLAVEARQLETQELAAWFEKHTYQ
jgi:prophage maintenance system killer protein